MKIFFIVLICCLWFSVSSALPSYLKITYLNETDPDAMCNDGSSAAFYFKQGDPNKWIFYMQGGAWCWDDTSCIARIAVSDGTYTSNNFSAVINRTGIFDDDPTKNPDWHNATYAYLPYCSSDSFTGNSTAIFVFQKTYFKGKVILNAALKVLLPMGLAKASSVLVAGSSAGGAAVLANIDYIAETLNNYPLPNRIIRGHNDGGFFLDATPLVKEMECIFKNVTILPPFPPIDLSITEQMGFHSIFEEGVALWDGWADDDCMKRFGLTEAWKCYLYQYALPYVKTPILTHQETVDSAQFFGNAVFLPCQKYISDYIPEFRTNISAVLAAVPLPHKVFAPSCYDHVVLEAPTFWSITINGTNDYMALNQFFSTNSSYSNLIDGCQGFNCSVGCPLSEISQDPLLELYCLALPPNAIPIGDIDCSGSQK